VKNSVIPTGAKVTAWILCALALIGLLALVFRHRGPVPEFFVLIPIMVLLAGYTLLVGYVHGDARRRGMRYVMWTWLAILVPNGIGIILYFILRDPIPNFCTRCGAAARQNYSFCPQCGNTIAATCFQCHQVMQAGWTHCAYCGARLG